MRRRAADGGDRLRAAAREARAALGARARAIGARLVEATTRDTARPCDDGRDGRLVDLDDAVTALSRACAPLPGPHQRDNLLVAVRAARERHGPRACAVDLGTAGAGGRAHALARPARARARATAAAARRRPQPGRRARPRRAPARRAAVRAASSGRWPTRTCAGLARELFPLAGRVVLTRPRVSRAADARRARAPGRAARARGPCASRASPARSRARGGWRAPEGRARRGRRRQPLPGGGGQGDPRPPLRGGAQRAGEPCASRPRKYASACGVSHSAGPTVCCEQHAGAVDHERLGIARRVVVVRRDAPAGIAQHRQREACSRDEAAQLRLVLVGRDREHGEPLRARACGAAARATASPRRRAGTRWPRS